MPDHVAKHFKKADPALFAVYRELKPVFTIPSGKYATRFSGLCRIIVGQQLSGKAADAIWKRFLTHFPGKKVTAARVRAYTIEELRQMGMSYAKARALHDLADKTLARQINWKRIETFDERGVFEELIKVKGVGPWTIEMFLMFALGREDIFSYGDLGLQKGIQKLYKLKKKPTPRQFDRITKKWSPYRTYAALLLWRSVDGV